MNIQMYMFLYIQMRDEKEGRKKQARSNKQTRQSNTAHPRQSLFLEKMSCLIHVINKKQYLYICMASCTRTCTCTMWHHVHSIMACISPTKSSACVHVCVPSIIRSSLGSRPAPYVRILIYDCADKE